MEEKTNIVERSTPEMSVIIITPDCFATIRRTIEHLRAQSVRDQLEVVIVAPSAENLEIDEQALAPFCGSQVVEVGGLGSVGEANAAGVRRARAPIVAFVEEHSYPEPGWAEALLEAHLQPWAAVGPTVGNANQDSIVACADYLIAYGPWMDPSSGGIRDLLPGHNSSYKRELLLDFGLDLERMLESETILHLDLRNKGHQLLLEPKARISHLNYESFSVWIRAQYLSGRAFAAGRAEHWPIPRRLLYACGGPLIPLVRLRRILGQIRGARQPLPRLATVLPTLLLGLAVSASGEMIGYCWGAGDAVQRRWELEFHRAQYVKAQPQSSEPERLD